MFQAAVISRVTEKDLLVGYLIANPRGATEVVLLDNLKCRMESLRESTGYEDIFSNAVYEEESRALTGIHGNDLAGYPSIDRNRNRQDRGGMTVAAVVLDSRTKQAAGVVAYNSSGAMFTVTMVKLNELCGRIRPVNFRMTAEGGVLLPVMPDGAGFPVIEMSVRREGSGRVSIGEGNTVTQNSPDELPLLQITGFSVPSAGDTEKKCQQLLMETLINLKRLSPYYHTILSAITRKPAPGLGTCAVTEDTLYYDPEFIITLSVPEITFILIHEVMHIAMQHSVRFGRRTDHELWNIACDLYINSIICKDFHVYSSHNVEKTYTIEGKPCTIRVPPFGVFPDSIRMRINLAAETPETIYDRLMRENPRGALPLEDGSGGSRDGAAGKGSFGAPQGNGHGASSPEDGTGEPQPGGIDNLSDTGSFSGYSPQKSFQVRLGGKKLKGILPVDIMTGRESSGSGKKQDAVDEGRRALQRIRTRIALEEEKNGELLKKTGSGGPLVKRYLEFGLSPQLRWQELVQNLCTARPRKIFTVAPPNVDYMNRGITLAARQQAGKPDGISKIKLCVDISGSLSQQELSWILSEISGIFRVFRLDGELIYWSATVGSAGPVSSLKDLIRIDPLTDGDTDVCCVFQYLDGETTVNGRREKDRVRDIPAVFIFTDGCFEHNYERYAEPFGKKTVWIVTGSEVLFQPLFGRVVPLNRE